MTSAFIEEARRRRHRGKAINVESEAQRWTGDVERLSELSPERRVAIGLEPEERRRSVVAIRICSNIYCRNWTPSRLKYCAICHT